jgi:hypothetical protein
LEWFEIPCIGICSGLFEITLVVGSWMHDKYSLSVQVKLAKDWERPTKRAITAIIMHSDKILLTKA